MSKLLLFDFECSKHGTFEELAPSKTHEAPCPTCGKKSPRIVSGTRLDWVRMGVSNDNPTCASKWEKMQRQKAKQKDSYNLKMY